MSRIVDFKISDEIRFHIESWKLTALEKWNDDDAIWEIEKIISEINITEKKFNDKLFRILNNEFVTDDTNFNSKLVTDNTLVEKIMRYFLYLQIIEINKSKKEKEDSKVIYRWVHANKYINNEEETEKQSPANLNEKDLNLLVILKDYIVNKWDIYTGIHYNWKMKKFYNLKPEEKEDFTNKIFFLSEDAFLNFINSLSILSRWDKKIISPKEKTGINGFSETYWFEITKYLFLETMLDINKDKHLAKVFTDNWPKKIIFFNFLNNFDNPLEIFKKYEEEFFANNRSPTYYSKLEKYIRYIEGWKKWKKYTM